MIVAYTGYGRIATLGEEVRNPGVTIPKAIIGTLLISMLLYLCVAVTHGNYDIVYAIANCPLSGYISFTRA